MCHNIAVSDGVVHSHSFEIQISSIYVLHVCIVHFELRKAELPYCYILFIKSIRHRNGANFGLFVSLYSNPTPF